MIQHAPGHEIDAPWTIKERTDGRARIVGASGQHIAMIWADCAQIAVAAPELLEAAKNLIQFAEACKRACDDRSGLIQKAIQRDIDAARTAIAKARGEG